MQIVARPLASLTVEEIKAILSLIDFAIDINADEHDPLFTARQKLAPRSNVNPLATTEIEYEQEKI